MTKKCIQCFNSFSAATRLGIIRQLRKGPHNVSQIGEKFNLSQPTISYHLAFLQKVGILKSKKQGRQIYYFINEKYPCEHCVVTKI